MRRLLFMLLVLFATSVMAQKRVDLNRNFSLSGKLHAYSEEESLDDIIICKEGTKWHLTNEFIAGRNHVKFWVTAPDSEEEMFYTRWSADDVVVFMAVNEDKSKYYYVDDDVFNNLLIIEREQGALIRKCSILLDK